LAGRTRSDLVEDSSPLCDARAAREAWTAAAGILEDLGHPAAAAVREKLTAL
jgi:hypothetical protein